MKPPTVAQVLPELSGNDEGLGLDVCDPPGGVAGGGPHCGLGRLATTSNRETGLPYCLVCGKLVCRPVNPCD